MLWRWPFRYLTPEVSRAALRRYLDSSTTSNGNSQATLPGSGGEARTVVVAGGQALVRATRRSVLSRAGLEVAADVADASRAAKAAELYEAGLVLVDSEISGGCVFAIRRIAERSPGTAVLVVASRARPRGAARRGPGRRRRLRLRDARRERTRPRRRGRAERRLGHPARRRRHAHRPAARRARRSRRWSTGSSCSSRAARPT